MLWIWWIWRTHFLQERHIDTDQSEDDVDVDVDVDVESDDEDEGEDMMSQHSSPFVEEAIDFENEDITRGEEEDDEEEWGMKRAVVIQFCCNLCIYVVW